MANKIDLVQTEIIRIRIRVQTLEREAISKDAELLLKREEIGSLQGFDQTRLRDIDYLRSAVQSHKARGAQQKQQIERLNAELHEVRLRLASSISAEDASQKAEVEEVSKTIQPAEIQVRPQAKADVEWAQRKEKLEEQHRVNMVALEAERCLARATATAMSSHAQSKKESMHPASEPLPPKLILPCNDVATPLSLECGLQRIPDAFNPARITRLVPNPPQLALESLAPAISTGQFAVIPVDEQTAKERMENKKSIVIDVTAEKREKEKAAAAAEQATSPVGSTIWILPDRNIAELSLETLEAVIRKQGFELTPNIVEGDDARQIRQKMILAMPDFNVGAVKKWQGTAVDGMRSLGWCYHVIFRRPKATSIEISLLATTVLASSLGFLYGDDLKVLLKHERVEQLVLAPCGVFDHLMDQRKLSQLFWDEVRKVEAEEAKNDMVKKKRIRQTKIELFGGEEEDDVDEAARDRKRIA